MTLDNVRVEETFPGSGLWLWYALSPAGVIISHGRTYSNVRAPMRAAENVFDLVARDIPLYVHPYHAR